MGVLGARRGDFPRCLAGDPEACERIYFGYFLFPRLQKVLEDLELIRTPVPPIPGPIPRPDPPPFDELVPFLLAPYLKGDPAPQPNFSAKVRLQATVKFRDGLREVVKALDEDISQLEQKGKKGRGKK